MTHEQERQTYISDIDSEVSESELRTRGLSINNIVASLRLERELDLEYLNAELENTEYHPETYPSLIYRGSSSDGISVLTPSSGRLAIVGAKGKQELIEATQKFLDALDSLGVDTDETTDSLRSQNITVSGELGRELDLAVVSLSLDLESVEYNPDKFPALIYRIEGLPTILIFSSGKYIIAGARSFEEILDTSEALENRLEEIGIQF